MSSVRNCFVLNASGQLSSDGVDGVDESTESSTQRLEQGFELRQSRLEFVEPQDLELLALRRCCSCSESGCCSASGSELVMYICKFRGHSQPSSKGRRLHVQENINLKAAKMMHDQEPCGFWKAASQKAGLGPRRSRKL